MKVNMSDALLKPPLVMIVDDNFKNLQVVAKILDKFNYELSLMSDSKKVIAAASEILPDLILLDVMMPGIDGYELCKSLKKHEHTKDIPVIFLTAKTGTDDLVKGFECGGIDYIKKPFNHKELVARVSTHIELKRSREEIKTLRGYIPICAKCKKIRDDDGYWEDVEKYVESRSYAKFSHGICPDCIKEEYPEFYRKMKKD